MTFRQTLYQRLPVWLAFITAGNGYTNTLDSKKFFKGVMPASSNNQHLSAWYFLGDGKEASNSEDDNNPVMECSLYCGIFFKTELKEAALIDFYESLLSDVHKWIYQGSGITAGKHFMPDSEYSGVIGNMQSYEYQGDNPVMSFKENSGELCFEVKIKYLVQA